MQGSEHWVFIERETPRLEAIALKKALGTKKEAADTGASEVKTSTSVLHMEMAVGEAKEAVGPEEPADAALDTRARAKMIASPEDFESVWEDEIYEKETRGEPSQETERRPAASAEQEPQEPGEEATASSPALPKLCQQPEERPRDKILGPEPPQGESEAVSKDHASAASKKQEARVPAAATELIKIKAKVGDDSLETSVTQRIIYLGDPEGEAKDSKPHLLLEAGGQLGLEGRPEAAVSTSGEGCGHTAPVTEGFQPPSTASQQDGVGKPAEVPEQPMTGCDGTGLMGRPTLGQVEGLLLLHQKASAGPTGCEVPEGGEALLCSPEVGAEETGLQSPVEGLKPCGLAGGSHGAEEHGGSPVQSPDICTAAEGLSGSIGADVDKEESARVVLQMEEIETKSPPLAVPWQGRPHSTVGWEGDKHSSPAPMPFPQQSSPVPAEPALGAKPEGRDLSQATSPVGGVGIPKDVNPSAEAARQEVSPVVGKGAPKDMSPAAEVAAPRGTNPESEEQPQDMGFATWRPDQGASPVAGWPPRSTDSAAEPMQGRDLAMGEVAQDMDPVTARATQSQVSATEVLLQEEKPMMKEARDEGCGTEELSHDESPCREDLSPKAEGPEQQPEAMIRDLPQEGPAAGGLLHAADPNAQEPPRVLEFNAGQDLQGRSPTVGESTKDGDFALGQLPEDESPPKATAGAPHSYSPIAGLCQGSKIYQLLTGGEELQDGSGTHQMEPGSLVCVAGRTGAASREHGGVTVAPGSWQDSESYRKTSVASKIKMFEQSEAERRAAQEGQERVPEAETSAKANGKTGLMQDMRLNTGLASLPAVPVAPVGLASSVDSLALRQGAGSGDASQPPSLKGDVSVDLEHEGEDSADLASPDSGCELTLAEAVVTLPMNCPDGKFMRMLCGSLLSC